MANTHALGLSKEEHDQCAEIFAKRESGEVAEEDARAMLKHVLAARGERADYLADWILTFARDLVWLPGDPSVGNHSKFGHLPTDGKPTWSKK